MLQLKERLEFALECLSSGHLMMALVEVKNCIADISSLGLIEQVYLSQVKVTLYDAEAFLDYDDFHMSEKYISLAIDMIYALTRTTEE